MTAQDRPTLKGYFTTGSTIAQSEMEDLIDSFEIADADLAAIAAVSPSNDDVLQRKAGAWTNRTIAQLKTDLATDLDDLTDVAVTTPATGDTLEYDGAGWVNVAPPELRAITDNIEVTPNGNFIDLSVDYTLPGGFDPTRNGMLGWTLPFVVGTAAQALVSGTIYVFKCFAQKDMTISRFWFNADAALTSGTAGQNWMGLYDAAGTRLQLSADQTTAFAAGGATQVDLTASQAIAKGDAFYIALLTNASGTQLGIRRGGFSSSGNLGLSGGANLLFGTAGTAQTTLPASFTPSSAIVSTGSFTLPIGYS